MYARVTRFELKPDKLEEAYAIIEKLRPQIMEITGLKEYISLRSYDGRRIVVITIYESKLHADTATQRALQLWVKLTEYFASSPESSSYEIVAHAFSVDWMG